MQFLTNEEEEYEDESTNFQQNVKTEFPREIWEEIFLYLDITSLVQVSSVNKEMFEIASSNYLWKKFVTDENHPNLFQKYLKQINMPIFQYYHFPTYSFDRISKMKQNDDYFVDMKENDNLYKLEYSIFRKNQILSKTYAQLVRNKTYIDYSKYDNPVYWIPFSLFTMMVLFIVSIILPIHMDGIIPTTGFYFLINWVPLAICSLLYFLTLFYLATKLEYFPFFTQSQFFETQAPPFSVFFGYQFLFIPLTIIGIGVKLIAFRNEEYWLYCLLPALISILVIFINDIPSIHSSLSNAGTEAIPVVLTVVGSLIFFGLGILYSVLNLDHTTNIQWSLVFIPFYIPFIAWFSLPMIMAVIEKDLCIFVVSMCAFWGLILLSSFIWIPLMLIGLKLDGIITATFVQCFIPIFIFEGFFGFVLLFVGVVYFICCDGHRHFNL
eukprot:gene7088-11251_t